MSVVVMNGKMITTEGSASICNTNGICFVNGERVPNEEGEYNIKGTKVKVTHCGNSGNICINGDGGSLIMSNNSFGKNSSIQIGNIVCENGVERTGKDYVISGMNNKIKKNIIVKGDIIISGINNKVKFGKENIDYETLEIEGNLIISGMETKVKNIIRLDGKVHNNGINNTIKRVI